MPDQPLNRRQADLHLVPQRSPGSLEELTEEQFRAIGRVTVMTIVETSTLYGHVEKLMAQVHHSDELQRRFLSRTANAVHNYDVAVDAVQRRAISEIIANRPPEVVTRIIEVPKKGVLPRLFGK
jgi:uncharacterized protein Yka (UPF0111/DUF47 family)